MTGTEPLYRSVRVAVIDQFFITCDNPPDKSIIHGITYRLTTDIHSRLCLLMCQFMRCRSKACVWFFKRLNLPMYGYVLMRQVLLTAYEYLFTDFLANLRIFSISHNLGLRQRGKSLVFASPVLKHWNHCCCQTLTKDTFSFHFTYSSIRGGIVSSSGLEGL